MRALAIELVHELFEALLLLQQVRLRRPSRLVLERAMHPLV
jgi:hypothetical protein